jgi:hypothetical protein
MFPLPDVLVPQAAPHGWPEVRISAVEVAPILTGHRAGWSRVAAVVELGDLAPADVVVTLVPVSLDPERAARAVEADRLWSVTSYHNGAYRFETDVPLQRLRGPERLKVHVGPAAHVLTAFTRGTPSGCWHLVPALPDGPAAGAA